ncbi:MAG: hypothetical protein IKK70_01600 [Clostridia bacterium]|nr:hypothetical protein [Clostridia bacterium]
MSSAFKNFFLTFAIALLVFALLAFLLVKPAVLNLLKDDEDEGTDVSDDIIEESGDDVSEDVSVPVVDPGDIDETADIFTAVILCVDSNGRALNTVFIDSNAQTKRFIYCPIASSVKTTNEIGVTVPIGDLFSTMTPDNIAQCVTAMTGIETDYCLKFDRNGVRAMAAMIPGASVVLNEDVVFINPAYADFVPELGQPYPDDYYITVSNVDGRVLLNEQLNGRSKLDWLLEYNPNLDGSEYNAIYSLIAKSIITQFFENESMLKSTNVMATVIKSCETNLTSTAASEHLETIFSYNDFSIHKTNYPASWETAVTKLRELDGRFD